MWLSGLRHRFRRERRERDARKPEPGRNLPEHDSRGMPRIERFLAIAQHDQHALAGDAAQHKPEHVERRLVCPVDVLHHEHRRLVPVEVIEQCGGDLVWNGLAEKGLLEAEAS